MHIKNQEHIYSEGRRFGDNYSMASESLWIYCRDGVNDDVNENDNANNRINNNKITKSKSFV